MTGELAFSQLSNYCLYVDVWAGMEEFTAKEIYQPKHEQVRMLLY